mgnify:CR=1 FL=1
MRDIKFRAWDSLEGKMYSWTELLNQNLKNIFTIPEQCGYNIMQYTGLKDKNGKEIYEGDIIFVKGETKLLDIKGKVEYSNILAQFIITNTGNIVNEAELLGDYEEEDIEKIGNVYDNPELLEEGE